MNNAMHRSGQLQLKYEQTIYMTLDGTHFTLYILELVVFHPPLHQFLFFHLFIPINIIGLSEETEQSTAIAFLRSDLTYQCRS